MFSTLYDTRIWSSYNVECELAKRPLEPHDKSAVFAERAISATAYNWQKGGASIEWRESGFRQSKWETGYRYRFLATSWDFLEISWNLTLMFRNLA